MFFHRHRLARQRGFLNLQIDGFNQARIRRNPVAGIEENHISGHQIPRRNLHLRAIAQYGRGGRGHLPQSINRLLRPVLLHKPQQHRKQDNDGDHDRFDAVAQKE